MDFFWKYSILVFNVTNKDQYRKGVLHGRFAFNSS